MLDIFSEKIVPLSKEFVWKRKKQLTLSYKRKFQKLFFFLFLFCFMKTFSHIRNKERSQTLWAFKTHWSIYCHQNFSFVNLKNNKELQSCFVFSPSTNPNNKQTSDVVAKLESGKLQSCCCSGNLLFWCHFSWRTLFSPNSIKKKDKTFLIKSKKNDTFWWYIQVMNNERKTTKEGFGHFYGKPGLRQNLKMTSKKKDELRYLTSYIYEARRERTTFPKV